MQFYKNVVNVLIIRVSRVLFAALSPTVPVGLCGTDSDLEPFTTYEYRVSGWNSFGRGLSNVTAVATSEDKPWGVAPPRWRRLSERDDIIQLHWQPPARPNGVYARCCCVLPVGQRSSHVAIIVKIKGAFFFFFHFQGEITHYAIQRDGQERYRGDENSFTDVGGIRPFQEYRYRLRVCNRAGCTDSPQVSLHNTPADVSVASDVTFTELLISCASLQHSLNFQAVIWVVWGFSKQHTDTDKRVFEKCF